MTGEETEQERALLRVRALTLQKLADNARVFTGTLAERVLEQGRADIAGAIIQIDGGQAAVRPLADLLKTTAIAIGGALYMSGTDGADGTPVRELTAQLAAWCGDPSGA